MLSNQIRAFRKGRCENLGHFLLMNIDVWGWFNDNSTKIFAVWLSVSYSKTPVPLGTAFQHLHSFIERECCYLFLPSPFKKADTRTSLPHCCFGVSVYFFCCDRLKKKGGGVE